MVTNETTEPKTESKAKILLYDLEVSPMLAWAYGPSWETRLIKIEEWQKILSISWRWYGEEKINHINLHNHSEESLMLMLRSLLDNADIAIAHNGKRFDDRISRGAFLMAGLTPPSPWKNIDTKIVAKQLGFFPSNSLNDLCEMFGFGTKTKETYADLWYDCLRHDNAEAWAKMEKYNNQDVELLTKLYDKFKPYITNHPNIATITGRPEACPKCGSDKLQARGTRNTNSQTYQRFQCTNCGGWCSSRKSEKTTPTNFVNYS